MKKIIILLFLFLLSVICYLTYNLTEKKEIYILAIGDETANIIELSNKDNTTYNNDYINENYRILDILDTLKYNKEIIKNDELVSIHRLLKKANKVIISIGMNDIYYKLNDNTQDIYTYINNMIDNYEEILKEINKYDYQKVYVLGYYNITNDNSDIFTYANYKLRKITKRLNYTYVELNKTLNNNQKYYQKEGSFQLNKEGYSQIYKLIVEK